MKKHTKLISAVLAIVLALSAFAIMTVAVSAAEDDYDYDWDYSEATPDTPIAIDHIELISLPTITEYISTIGQSISLDGLEYNVYYADGTISTGDEEHIVYKYTNSDGEEEYDYCSVNPEYLPIGENTITLLYMPDWSYDYETYADAIEIGKYTFNVAENPLVSTVESIEIVKKPDKVFTDVYHFYNPETDMESYMEDYKNNSIWFNMNGAQMQINFTDGTSEVYSFCTEEGWWPIYIYYQESTGIRELIDVTDLGNYKAEVSFAGKTTVFEAKHTGSSTSDAEVVTPTTPSISTPENTDATSSTSSTSDTTTNDTVVNGKDNGTVATGSALCSLAVVLMLAISGAVVVFFNRKRYTSLH